MKYDLSCALTREKHHYSARHCRRTKNIATSRGHTYLFCKQSSKYTVTGSADKSVIMPIVILLCVLVLLLAGGIHLYNDSRRTQSENMDFSMSSEISSSESFEQETRQVIITEARTSETITESQTEDAPLSLTYEIKGGYVEITGCKKESETILIPEKINDVPVERISDHAFQDCSNLVSVDFPNTLAFIGKYAFQNCLSLQEINLPLNLSFISPGLFSGCSSLKAISIPSNATIIGDSAFENCTALRSVEFTNVWYIGEGAFRNCRSLKTLSFSEYGLVKFIEPNAFSECNSITDIYGSKDHLEEKLASEFAAVFHDTMQDEFQDNNHSSAEQFKGNLAVRCNRNSNLIVCGDSVLLCPISGENLPEAFYFDTESITSDDWDKMKWESYNPSVASINDSVLTAIKPGKATIRCTYQDKKGNINICEREFIIIDEAPDPDLMNEFTVIDINEDALLSVAANNLDFEWLYGEFYNELHFDYSKYQDQQIDIALYTEAGIPAESFGWITDDGKGTIRLVSPSLDANWRYLKRSGYLTIIVYAADYDEMEGNGKEPTILSTKRIPLMVDLI